jgi:hypothetical protein
VRTELRGDGRELAAENVEETAAGGGQAQPLRAVLQKALERRLHDLNAMAAVAVLEDKGPGASGGQQRLDAFSPQALGRGDGRGGVRPGARGGLLDTQQTLAGYLYGVLERIA